MSAATESNTSNMTISSNVLTVFKYLIQIVLSPFNIILPLIQKIFLLNKYLLNHFIFIPLKLLFLITIYIPFIKIPIIIPLKFILELNDDWNEKNVSWFQSQIELFLINVIHFFMVNVFLGIFVGILTGLNLKFIRFLLTWNENKTSNVADKPLVKKKSYKSSPKLSKYSPKSKSKIKSIQPNSKKFPLNLDEVIIPDVNTDFTWETLGISQLPSLNKTISTGINPNVTHNIRDFKKTSMSSDEKVLIYEDDDGYQYSYNEKKLDEMNPNSQLHLRNENQLSNISEEEEEPGHDSSQFSTTQNDTFKTSFMSIKEEVEESVEKK